MTALVEHVTWVESSVSALYMGKTSQIYKLDMGSTDYHTFFCRVASFKTR